MKTAWHGGVYSSKHSDKSIPHLFVFNDFEAKNVRIALECLNLTVLQITKLMERSLS